MITAKSRASRVTLLDYALLVLSGCALLAGCSIRTSTTVSSLPAQPMPTGQTGSRAVTASWYGPGFEGRRTASGEIFHQNELTAASRTLPLGSRVTVTNPANGHSVVVKVNDRGPYVRGRSIDISRTAAARLGMTRQGLGRVEIARVSDGVRRAEPVSAPAPQTETSYGDLSGISKRPSRKWHLSVISHRQYYSHRSRRYRGRIVSDPIGSWLASVLPRF